MTDEEAHERLFRIVYEEAQKITPPSIGWDILADHHGMGVFDVIEEWADELFDEAPNLLGFAELLAEEVLRIAKRYGLAPFDGTLAEELETDETEQDWLIREDLLPFVKNLHRNMQARMGNKV